VHLNTKIPKYVKRNLVKLSKDFPEHQVVLISNLKQKKIPNVLFKQHFEPTQSIEIDSNLSHPKNFRANFWHSSIARFTYLLKHQTETGIPFLHVESDVILAKDFPIEIVAKNTNLAYPILSKYRGVASVFFSQGAEVLSHYVNFILTEVRSDHEITDMTALRKYYDLNPENVSVLPAGPSSISAYEPEIQKDLFGIIESGIKKYEGVFDGSDIGMYLFGTDPRNKLGYSILREEIATTYTKMSEMEFTYNAARDFIDVKNSGEWIPVYNLHMTCKDIKLFSTTEMRDTLLKYLSHKNRTEVFIFKVYLKMAFAKLLRVIRRSYR
jgi:hypothetical protein